MYEPDELQSLILGAAPEEGLDSEYTTLPTSDKGYVGTIRTPRAISKEKEDGTRWMMLIVPIEVEDEELQARLGPVGCRAEYSIFLDFDFEGGKLETGPNRNVKLGKLYAAAGLKDKSKVGQLEGRTVRFWHEIERYNEQDRARVTRISKV